MHRPSRFPSRLIPATLRKTVRPLLENVGLLAPKPTPRFAYPFRALLRSNPGLRPNYKWGAFCAALTAKTLNYPAISLLEFGVAGGNGLLALEQAAADAEVLSGVRIEVYGFDTGKGLPKPKDYRDLPQMWQEGDYDMDVEALQSKLQRAKLLLGDVHDTVPAFLTQQAAPVGFVSFDMDLYSSTMDAFGLFGATEAQLMPRVVCYFDDIIGFSHSEFTGERAAISDFNQRHEMRKISPLFGLQKYLGWTPWIEMMYMFHAFDHSRYGEWDGYNPLRQLPLQDRFSANQ